MHYCFSNRRSNGKEFGEIIEMNVIIEPEKRHKQKMVVYVLKIALSRVKLMQSAIKTF